MHIFVFSILLHRWQYFYISQVRLGYSPGCSESEIGPETLQHSEQLLCIFEVFGQALLQHDLNIFRTALAALENLNNKWKLYYKVYFFYKIGLLRLAIEQCISVKLLRGFTKELVYSLSQQLLKKLLTNLAFFALLSKYRKNLFLVFRDYSRIVFLATLSLFFFKL